MSRDRLRELMKKHKEGRNDRVQKRNVENNLSDFERLNIAPTPKPNISDPTNFRLVLQQALQDNNTPNLKRNPFTPLVMPDQLNSTINEEPVLLSSLDTNQQSVSQTPVPNLVPQTPQVLPTPKPVVPQTPQVLPTPKLVVPQTPQVVPQTPQVVPTPKPVVPQTLQVVPTPKPVFPQTPQVLPTPKPVVPQTPQVLPTPKPVVPQTPQVLPTPKPVVPQTPQVLPTPKPVVPQTPQVLATSKPVVPQTPQVVPTPKPFIPQTPQVVPTPKPFIPQTPQVLPTPKAGLKYSEILELNKDEVNKVIKVEKEDESSAYKDISNLEQKVEQSVTVKKEKTNTKTMWINLIKKSNCQALSSDVIEGCKDLTEEIIKELCENIVQKGKTDVSVEEIKEYIDKNIKNKETEISVECVFPPSVFMNMISEVLKSFGCTIRPECVYVLQTFVESLLVKMLNGAELVREASKRKRVFATDLLISYQIHKM